jgi:uncharacterized protein (DUF488 family)
LTRRLLTIGYAGLSLGEFIDMISLHGVRCLIDIRELPLSRKPGFSKSALSERLAREGIEYRHSRVLGSPRRLRHRFREAGNFKVVVQGLHRHLRTTAAAAALEEVARLAQAKRTCLMCCCGDYDLCHRKIVVEKMVARFPLTAHELRRDPPNGCRRAG